MKCCNEPLNLRFLYRHNIAVYECDKCGKFQDITIPDHIPKDQFEQYANKKYRQIEIIEKKLIDKALYHQNHKN